MTTTVKVGLAVGVLVVLVAVIFASMWATGAMLTTGAKGKGWSSGSAVKTNSKMASFLDNLAAATGIELYVTSGIRTAEDQARALLAKVDLGETVEDLHSLYKRDDLIDELAGLSTADWARALQAQIDRGDLLSSHMSGEALDLRTTTAGTGQLSSSQQTTVKAAAEKLGARVVIESTPAHMHLEIGEYA